LTVVAADSCVGDIIGPACSDGGLCMAPAAVPEVLSKQPWYRWKHWRYRWGRQSSFGHWLPVVIEVFANDALAMVDQK